MTMPVSDLRDPEYRDATGTQVKYLYCPDCGYFSGACVASAACVSAGAVSLSRRLPRR